MACPPAAEKQEEADDGPADHGPRGGECPVVDRGLFCLLDHGLEFVEKDLGIEFARDLGVKLVDGCGYHLAFQLFKQLSQGPGPIESLGVNLDFLPVIGRDDVVHGPDVTAWVDPDSLA